MNGDLSNLERKIDATVAYCQALRDQNRALRERIAGLEGEKQSLTAKIDTARERLEALMTRLPPE